MKMFAFAGWSGSGKTRLLCRLIAALAGRGKRVAAVKGSHREAALQPEAKDTALFLEAGAGEVFYLSGRESLRMRRHADAEAALAGVRAECAGCDLVLLEGLYPEGVPVIAVAGADGLKPVPGKLAAVVGPGSPPSGVPVFAADDTEPLLRFMEEYHG